MGMNTNTRTYTHTSKRKDYKYDKQLFNVNTTTTNNQSNTTIFTTTYPCVVMGILILGTSSNNTDASNVPFQWTLARVEEGQTVDTISFAASSYQPEQDVLCFGAGISNLNTANQFMCKVKTGRKLKQGDQLIFSCSSNVAAKVVGHCYTIQFFLKV